MKDKSQTKQTSVFGTIMVDFMQNYKKVITKNARAPKDRVDARCCDFTCVIFGGRHFDCDFGFAYPAALFFFTQKKS